MVTVAVNVEKTRLTCSCPQLGQAPGFWEAVRMSFSKVLLQSAQRYS